MGKRSNEIKKRRAATAASTAPEQARAVAPLPEAPPIRNLRVPAITLLTALAAIEVCWMAARGCNSDETPSGSSAKASPAPLSRPSMAPMSHRIDRSLGQRQPIPPDLIDRLNTDFPELGHWTGNLTENPDGTVRLFMPNFHIKNPQWGNAAGILDSLQAQQRELFEMMDYLIRTYDIRHVGHEGGPTYLSQLRRIYLEQVKPNGDSVDDFLSGSIMPGATPTHYEVFRIALNEDLTFEERRSRLVRYAGLVHFSDLIQAIYVDCDDVEFLSVDDGNDERRNEKHEGFRQYMAPIKDGSYRLRSMPLSDAHERAEAGEGEWPELYCRLVREHRARIADHSDVIINNRNPIVSRHVADLPGNAIVPFGSSHSWDLYESSVAAGDRSAIFHPASYDVAFSEAHGLTPDMVASLPEPTIFSDTIATQIRTALVPDIDFAQPDGKVWHCADVLDHSSL